MNEVRKKLIMTRFISTYCRKCSNEVCLFLLKIRKGNPKVEVKGDDILIFIDNELLPAKFEFRKGTLITLEQIGQPTCFQENGV